MQKLHAGTLSEKFTLWPVGNYFIPANRQKLHTGLNVNIAYRSNGYVSNY